MDNDWMSDAGDEWAHMWMFDAGDEWDRIQREEDGQIMDPMDEAKENRLIEEGLTTSELDITIPDTIAEGDAQTVDHYVNKVKDNLKGMKNALHMAQFAYHFEASEDPLEDAKWEYLGKNDPPVLDEDF